MADTGIGADGAGATDATASAMGVAADAAARASDDVGVAVALDSGYFAVEPKRDCPHVALVRPMLEFELESPCCDCGHVGENWVCLACSTVRCSRYINGCMLKHYEDSRGTLPPSLPLPPALRASGHAVAFSFSDFSFWCFECDSYVESPALRPIKRGATVMRFGEERAREAFG
ncbi:uncharacterized protein MONBRDRAFT_8876 [Monosiga brevicollis MX1]|uniref:UBP-type domain-containing protein n=1 Tax=Monosiga brevicollis TaxID=81824 RepID=A9V1D9_MONBE|nr:uncharacterized protein MONBRDRAFT_8876 [Monosiga brevicollis MX1]EDQ88423.1 predicted protein [Monosiga brevicollis MX1]|eukprot:XP_001746527.1 hypothetical protein [Monosiga brevicollis MX1]